MSECATQNIIETLMNSFFDALVNQFWKRQLEKRISHNN